MATDATFDRVMNEVFDLEGGFNVTPGDPGGATNFGISQRAYPDLDIRSLTRSDARAIYKRDYWDGPRISSLYDSVAAPTFNLGVNIGTHGAIRIAQQAMNNTGGALKADGVIGKLSIAASSAVPAERFLPEMRKLAAAHYLGLIAHNPTLAKFRQGWLRRASTLR